MATQTTTARQAAGHKAATTRKRNAAKQRATRTKAPATQTTKAVRSTARSARSTTKRTTRSSERRADAATSGLQALARQAERAVLIPLGAALEVRDTVRATVRTYSDPRTARRELDRLERRGERAVRRNRRSLEHQIKVTRRDVERRTDGLRSDAAVDQIRNLV
jgi:hypothetical protein